MNSVQEDSLPGDFVIFTPSLGVLKEQAGSLFEPQLPKSHMKAINLLKIGTVDKIHFEWEHQWWPQDSEGIAFLYEDNVDYRL